jgi:hypothetical protein
MSGRVTMPVFTCRSACVPQPTWASSSMSLGAM